MPRKIDNVIEAAARQRGQRATLSVGRFELCDYVADVAAELASLAKAHDLRFLSYLLGMVVEEAKNQSRIASECRHLPPASADIAEN